VTLVTLAADANTSLNIQLLTDLRTVCGTVDVMATEMVLAKLHELNDSPWGDLRGKPLDARGLANRLRRYEVKRRRFRSTPTRPRDIAVKNSRMCGHATFLRSLILPLSCLRLDWTLLMSQFIVDSSLQLASGDLGPPRSWRLP
jgi:Protein of unknown function (DUF3631)